VLALPGDEGGDDGLEDVLVYLIPALALLAAAGGIGLALNRWRGRRPQPAGPGPAAEDARVEKDMERYDL
jgi:hypothetical protein